MSRIREVLTMLKPTKILVPTDFSEYSDKALKQAFVIAAEYNAQVFVLHVVHERIHGALSDDYSDISITRDVIQNLQRDLRERARTRLQKQVKRFPESRKVAVTQIVANGVPYEEILREQEQQGVDLIVIASLGQSGIARFLIGGVARNVLKAAKCPVLLTKDIFLSKPTKILVPTDFSEYSDKALKQALDVARQYGARVYLLHVLPVYRQYAIDYPVPQELLDAHEKQGEDAVRGEMANQRDKFPQAKEVEVIPEIARGLTYELILEKAEEEGIDLIVIASLGQSGIARYLIGGVARNVLKGAKCPVLITR
jgi:universal stress protein A